MKIAFTFHIYAEWKENKSLNSLSAKKTLQLTNVKTLELKGGNVPEEKKVSRLQNHVIFEMDYIHNKFLNKKLLHLTE